MLIHLIKQRLHILASVIASLNDFVIAVSVFSQSDPAVYNRMFLQQAIDMMPNPISVAHLFAQKKRHAWGARSSSVSPKVVLRLAGLVPPLLTSRFFRLVSFILDGLLNAPSSL